MMGGVAMARITDLHKKWMKEPKYRKAYAGLKEEFAFASAVIDARNRAGLTQHALARKMGTTQPVVARLESGRTRPSMAHAGAPGQSHRVTSAHPFCASGAAKSSGMAER